MTRVLIRGGTVIDGSGRPARLADVAVENERIVAVEPGLSASPADVIVDARDRVVAPGFIDIHTHYDAQVFWDPSLASSCFHGVTTVVSGNCGFSLAPLRRTDRDVVLRMLRDLEDMPLETLSATVPLDVGSFADYLNVVEGCEPTLNFASFVGHSTLRIAAMGPAAYERAASDDEIAAMCRIVDDSIAGGAIGFATKTRPSTRPCPSQFATGKETESLLRVLSKREQGVAMFNPGGAYDLERVYETQSDIGRPFTWIALMAMPDGSHRAQLELHNAWTARGAHVHPQVSCRPLVAQCTLALPSILRAPALTTLAGSSTADRLAAYRSPAWREEFRRGQEWLVAARDPWRDLVVISSASNANCVGRSIAAIAAELNSDPVDVLFDLAVDDGLETTVQLTYGNSDQAEVSELLGVEGTVLGLSDGGAHPAQSCDAVLPTDLLGPWVRDRKALTLERAVHKLTAEPAALLGLAGRGLIRTGSFADLVVFDPKTIGPGPVRMIDDLPGGGERLVADRPTGIDHVLVNGVGVRVDGAMVESENAPGRVLRNGT